MQTIIRAHDESAVAVCWRSDGGIISGSLDGSVHLWKYDPEAERKALEAQASKDEKAKKESVVVISSSKKLDKAHHLGVTSLCTDPAGSRLISSGVSSEVHIWDLTSGYSKIRTLDTTPADVWRLAHSPITQQFASGGQGGTVNIFSSETGNKDLSVPTGSDFINSVAYSPDGKLVAAGSADGSISIVDVEAGAVVSRIHKAHLLPVQSVSFSSDGGTLYSGSYDRSIHCYDVSAVGGGGSSSSSSSSSSSNTAGLICSLMGHLHWVTCVAASPITSHHIASSSADRSVRVWDARKREQVHSFEGHGERVWSVSWNPEGGRLATVTDGGALGLFPASAFI
jgi:WD repeat-containing protein 61